MTSRNALQLVSATLAHVWKAGEQGGTAASEEPVVATGHGALDACLPGGGWPQGSLVELLQSDPARHVWQLVLPALAKSVQSASAGPVVLVGAPLLPFGPSLGAQGLPATRLLCVQADRPSARLWAAEQALRCAQVAAVMAWLPQARNPELRRLHLAAHQQGRLLFVMRDLKAAAESSPARLRLRLESAGETLQVHILKRRGPPLEMPVLLPAHPQRLAALLASRKGNAVGHLPGVPSTASTGRSHALDRSAAIG